MNTDPNTLDSEGMIEKAVRSQDEKDDDDDDDDVDDDDDDKKMTQLHIDHCHLIQV